MIYEFKFYTQGDFKTLDSAFIDLKKLLAIVGPVRESKWIGWFVELEQVSGVAFRISEYVDDILGSGIELSDGRTGREAYKAILSGKIKYNDIRQYVDFKGRVEKLIEAWKALAQTSINS